MFHPLDEMKKRAAGVTGQGELSGRARAWQEISGTIGGLGSETFHFDVQIPH